MDYRLMKNIAFAAILLPLLWFHGPRSAMAGMDDTITHNVPQVLATAEESIGGQNENKRSGNLIWIALGVLALGALAAAAGGGGGGGGGDNSGDNTSTPSPTTGTGQITTSW